MNIYYTKIQTFSGTDYREIHHTARQFYNTYTQRTHRRPYLRSAYFQKEKIFIDTLWRHLWEKNWRDRVRRMVFLPCAFELIEQSRCMPLIKSNPNKPSETLYRFIGCTPTKKLFYVQIKQNKRGQKLFLSVFPEIKKTSR